jgi:DnaJ like chaperone protein
MKYLLIILALIYVFFPYDLAPDLLVGWGWLDDIVVLGLLFRYLYLQKRKLEYRQAHDDRHRQGDHAKGQRQGGSGGADSGATETASVENDDPYAVLGVSPAASEDEIKSAFRKLVNKYHPDKVSHLGDEFKQLADRRFKEIQRAYQHVMKKDRS